MAVELYSAAIKLDSSHNSFFARRSKAYLARKHYAEALADADTVRTIFIMFSVHRADYTNTGHQTQSIFS
jgi:hypothetical protein